MPKRAIMISLFLNFGSMYSKFLLRKQNVSSTIKIRRDTMEINKIYCGDCLPILKTFDDCSVDAVITDPPSFIRCNIKRKEIVSR